MRLVQVDDVGVQPAQRVLHRALDPQPAQALVFVAHVHADLGEQQDLRASRGVGLEPASDQRLRLAALVPGHPARIDVRGVDGVEARVDERIEQLEAALLVGGPAEDVAAEDDGRDVQAGAAEGALLHGILLEVSARASRQVAGPSRACQFFLSNTSELLSLCIWKCDRKLLPRRTTGMDWGITTASTL